MSRVCGDSDRGVGFTRHRQIRGDKTGSTSHIDVYPAYLCPIRSTGRSSHPRPRRTILHNETADCKRRLCNLIDKLWDFVQERASCASRVGQVERKKNKILSAGGCAPHRELGPALGFWPVKRRILGVGGAEGGQI